MPHDHSHEHGSETSIASAFFLNLFFVVIEVIGGLTTNSFAILADALHDLGDTVSLAVSWYLERIARRKKDARFSFGYRRFSVLAALINSLVMLVGALFILSEVVPRLLHPHHANAEGMFLLAIFGIAINGFAAYRTRKGKSLNEQAVSLHMLEDVFGWVAILLASILIYFKDLHVIDPLLSFLITLYILWQVLMNLKQTLLIFLQGVPPEVKISNIEAAVKRIKGVCAMCDTNIWSLDGVNNVLSTHVVLDDSVKGEQAFAIKQRVKDIVRKNDIQHVTIELERKKEREPEEMGETLAEKPKEPNKVLEFVKALLPKTRKGKIALLVMILVFLAVLFLVTPESEEHEHDPNAPGHSEMTDYGEEP